MGARRPINDLYQGGTKSVRATALMGAAQSATLPRTLGLIATISMVVFLFQVFRPQAMHTANASGGVAGNLHQTLHDNGITTTVDLSAGDDTGGNFSTSISGQSSGGSSEGGT